MKLPFDPKADPVENRHPYKYVCFPKLPAVIDHTDVMTGEVPIPDFEKYEYSFSDFCWYLKGAKK
jgi:hypothetical protein